MALYAQEVEIYSREMMTNTDLTLQPVLHVTLFFLQIKIMETTSINRRTATHRRISENAESQILILRSSDPLASRPPSSTANDTTASSCPPSVATHARVATFQILII